MFQENFIGIITTIRPIIKVVGIKPIAKCFYKITLPVFLKNYLTGLETLKKLINIIGITLGY